MDRTAYKTRGLFLASSFKECEFYGRPLDNPIKVCLSNPLIDTEKNIIKLFFGESSVRMQVYESLLNDSVKNSLNVRFRLDADISRAAKKKGYDSIAIVTEKGLEKVKKGQLPRSIELNVLNIDKVYSDSIRLTVPHPGGVTCKS